MSVALLRGESLLVEERGEPGRSAAEALLPAVDACLAAARLGLSEVEAFAVSIGPGSFTSLRVGVATLKGLAFGATSPVVAVPTLEALVHGAPEGAGQGEVVAMLDARRGEVYAAGFLAGAPRLPEGVYTVDELAARVRPPCLLIGDGVEICGGELVSRLGSGVALVPAPMGVPSAGHVGVLGARRLAAGEGIPAAEVVPRYVRRAQAEVVRTGERFEAGR